MRNELRIARLREDQRRCVTKLHEAALDLIRHQDSVALLATTGKATGQDRQGLAIAQEEYQVAANKLALVTRELLEITKPQE